MISVATEGAIVFCKARAASDRLADVLAEVGYVPAPAGAIELEVCAGDQGVVLVAPVDKSVAAAIGRRLAQEARHPTRVLTVRLREERRPAITCDLDDLAIGPDGAMTMGGPWPREIERDSGGDIGNLCDGKAYFAVRVLLEDARDRMLADYERSYPIRVDPPPALDSPRLEEVARRIRLAERAEVIEVGGRTCVRTTACGARVMSYVSADELAALQRAGLLGRES